MTVTLEIVESPMPQSAEEEITYTLTTTPWSASAPSSPVIKVYDVTTGARTDVTTTVMPVNSPTVDGQVITLSPLKLLTAGSVYWIGIKFTAGGNIFRPHCIIKAEY